MTTEYRKEYTARRAEQLKTIMNEAIDEGNFEKFRDAFNKSFHYTKKRERDAFLRKWVETERVRRKGR
jgi:hypothetical protein